MYQLIRVQTFYSDSNTYIEAMKSFSDIETNSSSSSPVNDTSLALFGSQREMWKCFDMKSLNMYTISNLGE